ncbi:MAG: Trehalose/maltose import ATP-binding protein MalK [Methanoregulaceae archaeon PtaB.Bin056]|nr:MAG: Trehalose/maltose import ATP-binding protein MalK [Methanoregulaceae archaeon PtaB.Bin056]
MIRISGLRHGVLDILSLLVPAGNTAVIGPNGSGKTTLLRLLAGMEEPVQGSITIGGEPGGTLTVGWVHEFPGRNALFSRVRDEIASPLQFRHLECDEILKKVEEISGLLGISPLLDREPESLSGGEQVLVALATAMVSNPGILVLDEWDSHLDAHTTAVLQEHLHRTGVRWKVQCTQDMDLAASADTVLFLSGGQVLACGPPGEVFSEHLGSCWYPPSWRWREWSSSLTGQR